MALWPHLRLLARRFGVAFGVLALVAQTLAVALAPLPALAGEGGEGGWVLCNGGSDGGSAPQPDHEKGGHCDLCPVCFGAAHAIAAPPALPVLAAPRAVPLAVEHPASAPIHARIVREAAAARAPPVLPATV